MLKKFFFAAAILLVSTAAFSQTAAQLIDIDAPIIDSQIIKNDSTEVFMQLKNKASQNYELVAATSPVANKILLREPQGKNAVPKIVRSIIIPRNTEKDLQVGGAHVMLIGLKKSLAPGESVPLTLIYSDGSWITINATVN